MASLVGTSFAATYETVDGLTLTKQWEYTRYAGQWTAENVQTLATGNTGRMAATTDKYVIIPERDGDDNVFINLFDKNTGAFVKKTAVILDGVQFNEYFGAHNIGLDDYGHVWISNIVLKHENGAKRTLYYFTDLENGVISAVTKDLGVDCSTEGLSGDQAALRYDYCDLVGDVTREKNACVVIEASGAGTCAGVVGWRCEQGEDKWGPHMSGQAYNFQSIEELSYNPKGSEIAAFGSTTSVRIVRTDDPEQLGQLFYVNGQNTPPALYDTDGSLVDAFDFEKDLAVIPSGSQSGIAEFYFGDQLYFVVAATVNAPGGGAHLDALKASADNTLTGSTKLWRFPAEGCGEEKNGGIWNHSIYTDVVKDENGVEGCYVTHYQLCNGLGRYLIAPEGFVAGVNDVIADEDANAPVEYYNLQGVRVSNPAAGQLVIKKQGKTATKVFAL